MSKLFKKATVLLPPPLACIICLFWVFWCKLEKRPSCVTVKVWILICFGAGRLGGIPVGVVAVETRTVELSIPADPANLDSEAKVGWTPAHLVVCPLKTREEHLFWWDFLVLVVAQKINVFLAWVLAPGSGWRLLARGAPSPAVLPLLWACCDAGRRAWEIWQGKIISLFSCCDRIVSCSCCFDILLFSCLISQLWPYLLHRLFWVFSCACPFLSLLPILAAVTASGFPYHFFLGKSVTTLLLMLVTKGMSQFFLGKADPKHFTCCAPHCWFHIAALAATVPIFLCSYSNRIVSRLNDPFCPHR